MMEVKIEGIEALSKRLEGMSYEAQKKGGRFALRKAAQVVRDAARQNARRLDDSETGRSIAANITERWASRFNKRTGDLMFRVGVLGGAAVPKPKTADAGNPDKGAGSATPHWRLLEFGTEKMPAKPFMRPAMEQNIPQVTRVFITEWNKSIDRAIKKAGK